MNFASPINCDESHNVRKRYRHNSGQPPSKRNAHLLCELERLMFELIVLIIVFSIINFGIIAFGICTARHVIEESREIAEELELIRREYSESQPNPDQKETSPERKDVKPERFKFSRHLAKVD